MHKQVLPARVFLLIAIFTIGCEPAPTTPQATEAQTKAYPPTVAAPPYAGSESCRECHEPEFQSWQTSNHALAERPIAPQSDGPAFENQPPIQHGTLTSEVHLRDGKFEIIADGPDGRGPFVPERVFGNTPLRQFLISAEGGRYQASEVAYDPRTLDWFGVTGDEDRKPGEWGHWTGRGMNWNSNCADCHNTDLRKNYDAKSDSYTTTMAEMGVGCEACHGPAGKHVDWQRAHSGSSNTDPTLPELRAVQQPDPMLDTCGACHSRRTELRETFHPGERFGDSFMLAIPGHDDTWYPDGQVRGENYVFASFLMSRMYAEGVRCKDCHDPHTLQRLAPGNDLCMRCHVGKIDPVAHAHHDVAKPGGQCVDCHMPQTTYMQRHARRDHGFTIPDPSLTRDHGVPNACNRCHTKESTAWAIEAVDQWYGDRMQRWTQQRARLIARARAGQDGAAAELIDFARREPKPIWKAIAAQLLARWADQPDVQTALIELLGHRSDLVRAAAARALPVLSAEAMAALGARLADPVLALRIAAGNSLGANLKASSPVGKEVRAFLEHNADQPLGAMALASFLRDHGQLEQAIDRLERALEWQPDQAELHHELGVALSMAGRLAAAIAATKRACELRPREPGFWYNLGLARAEADDLEGAAEALERVCSLDETFARAWYNLGLAQNKLGRHTAAVVSLRKAANLEPRDVDIWFALGAVLKDAGRVEDARRVLDRVLHLDPHNAGARSLLEGLDAVP
jgi:Flp pilus assembly protein TadD